MTGPVIFNIHKFIQSFLLSTSRWWSHSLKLRRERSQTLQSYLKTCMRKFLLTYRSRWIPLKNICPRTRTNTRHRITRPGLNIEFCYFSLQESHVVIILLVCEYTRSFHSKEYMYQDLSGSMVGVTRSHS